MIRYVPTSGESVCSRLSNALWALALPPAFRGENVTQELFPCISAMDGSCWLVVDTEYQIKLHEEAEIDGIADVLAPWIQNGTLPEGTNEALSAFIVGNRGLEVAVWNLFPQYFKDHSKDEAGMIAANLFPPLP